MIQIAGYTFVLYMFAHILSTVGFNCFSVVTEMLFHR